MRTVFRAIARELRVPFVSLSKSEEKPPRSISRPAIIFTDHSNFAKCSWIIGDADSRLLHLIRDPRDIIISAMQYHCRSTEKWLHTARKAFGGMSYQVKLNSLPDDYSRYIFEMDRSAGRVISDIVAWNYNMRNCLECRYEELIIDTGMTLVDAILMHFGFQGEEVEKGKRIFWDNSLFGALQTGSSPHIRSGSTRQWRDVFDTALAQAFIDRFGDILVQIGYEPDNAWLSHCRTNPNPGDRQR